MDTLEQRLADLHIVQGAHHLSEMAHTGKHDLRRSTQLVAGVNQIVIDADFIQSVLDRP